MTNNMVDRYADRMLHEMESGGGFENVPVPEFDELTDEQINRYFERLENARHYEDEQL